MVLSPPRLHRQKTQLQTRPHRSSHRFINHDLSVYVKKPFLCNRLIEIQQLTTLDQRFLVLGRNNTADIASRSISAGVLIEKREWLFGPGWLAKSEGNHPVKRLQGGSDNAALVCEELRLVVATALVEPISIELERFGSWVKAFCVVANILLLTQRASIILN